MTATKDRFWAKVLFKEFIRHYRKMTPEQKVADIDESMDALEELDDSGESFGAKMVRWSMERAEQYPMASENGKKGGRPKKNLSADGDTREDSQDVPDGSDAVTLESATSADTGTLDSLTDKDERPGAERASAKPSRTLPLPTWESFLSFVDGEGLDYTDAREWWEMTMVDRKGLDRYGKPIGNWKGALKRFCKSKINNRRSA